MQLGCARNWDYPGLLRQQPCERDLSGRRPLALCDFLKQINQGLIRFSVLRIKARELIAEAVPPPLSSETQGRGQGGRGPQISRTTLLDAAHADQVSRDRSHREQLGAAPGRRKLDRRC